MPRRFPKAASRRGKKFAVFYSHMVDMPEWIKIRKPNPVIRLERASSFKHEDLTGSSSAINRTISWVTAARNAGGTSARSHFFSGLDCAVWFISHIWVNRFLARVKINKSQDTIARRAARMTGRKSVPAPWPWPAFAWFAFPRRFQTGEGWRRQMPLENRREWCRHFQ